KLAPGKLVERPRRLANSPAGLGTHLEPQFHLQERAVEEAAAMVVAEQRAVVEVVANLILGLGDTHHPEEVVAAAAEDVVAAIEAQVERGLVEVAEDGAGIMDLEAGGLVAAPERDVLGQEIGAPGALEAGADGDAAGRERVLQGEAELRSEDVAVLVGG